MGNVLAAVARERLQRVSTDPWLLHGLTKVALESGFEDQVFAGEVISHIGSQLLLLGHIEDRVDTSDNELLQNLFSAVRFADEYALSGSTLTALSSVVSQIVDTTERNAGRSILSIQFWNDTTRISLIDAASQASGVLLEDFTQENLTILAQCVGKLVAELEADSIDTSSSLYFAGMHPSAAIWGSSLPTYLWEEEEYTEYGAIESSFKFARMLHEIVSYGQKPTVFEADVLMVQNVFSLMLNAIQDFGVSGDNK